MQETWVWSLDWEDCLEKGMVTHSSILVWRIAMDRGARSPCSPWGHKQSDMTEWLCTAQHSPITLDPLYSAKFLSFLSPWSGSNSISVDFYSAPHCKWKDFPRIMGNHGPTLKHGPNVLIFCCYFQPTWAGKYWLLWLLLFPHSRFLSEPPS